MNHSTHNQNAAPVIDADFPGGNIVFQSMAGDVVKLHPDFRDSSGWFYWCFRARGFAGRRIKFQFTSDAKVLCPFGPAVSRDAGANWNWLGADSTNLSENSFEHVFQPSENDTRFCFSVPYLESNFQAFVHANAENPRLDVASLCRTKKGRDAELAIVKCVNPPKIKVLLTARHHACEATASYVLEGMLDATLNPFDGHTEFLAENVEILAVPFIDKDGVEDGDQGKNRQPRDHARDYEGESVHATTRAIREFVPTWSDGKLKVCFDLHCPHVGDEPDGKVFFVGLDNEPIQRQLDVFSKILEDTPHKTFPYKASNNIPFGVGWNTAKNFQQGKALANWCAERPDVALSSGVEIPYSNASGVPVTAESGKAFGKDMARVLGEFISRNF